MPSARRGARVSSVRLEQANVPMVKSQLPLIQAIQDEEYWSDITLPMVDEIRRARAAVYTDLPDSLLSSVAMEVDVPVYQTGFFSPGQYRKKVQKIIRDNTNHVAIAKLRRNQPGRRRRVWGCLDGRSTPSWCGSSAWAERLRGALEVRHVQRGHKLVEQLQ